jgi:hypothetical protein
MTRACAAAIVLVLVAARPDAVAAQSADAAQDPAATPPPTLVARAFGAFEWGATELPDTPNSFTLGQFDLFVTSNLSDRLSVLAEVVLEASTSTRVSTDLERLQLTFRWNDYVQVSAGRYHTGIGYYNAAFHHGAFFETAIGRPRVFAFEDEGGVLPVHEVGLTASGAIPKTASALHYLVETGNGRDWALDGVENEQVEVVDGNSAKSTNVGLAFRPPRVPALEVGGSFYRDRIPRPGSTDVAHRIGAAYVTYRTPALEVLAEWVGLMHRPVGGALFSNDGGYAQASRSWGRWRPYYRYERMAIDPGTPFIGEISPFEAHTIGLRVDPAEWVGIKAQYQRSDNAGLRGIDAMRTQLVFVF